MNAPHSFAELLELDSPLGPLRLLGDSAALQAILFPNQPAPAAARLYRREQAAPPLRAAAAQLDAYFDRRLTHFELPLSPRGTPFQRQVWSALAEIPFGQTRSYAEIAQRIGRPTASRAVGAANGCNPLPIVVPCHRVIGANGSLTGFAGGLEAKRLLLRLERAV